MKKTNPLEFSLTLDASASPATRAQFAEKLTDFSRQRCATHPGVQWSPGRRKAAETVLSATFIEWAVSDNPGISDFKDLVFAVETSLSEYNLDVHSYYAESAYKGGAVGMQVAANMLALGAQTEAAVKRAADDAYDVVFAYMIEREFIQKSAKPYKQ